MSSILQGMPQMPNVGNFYQPSYHQTPVAVGMYNTATWGQFGVDAYKPSFASQAMQRWMNEGIILYPMLDARSTITDSIRHGFRIKTSYFPMLTVTAPVRAVRAKSQTTLQVEHVNGIIPGMLFTVGIYGELMRVITVDSEQSVTVLRGMGDHIEPQDIPANTKLVYSGSVVEEASFRPLPLTSVGAEWIVHSHIIRNSWGASKTAKTAMNAYTSSIVQDSREDMLKRQALDIESAILFSQLGKTAYHGQPMRTAAGLIDYIRLAAPQNFISICKAINQEDLEILLNETANVQLTGSTSSSRISFSDSKARRTINDIAIMAGNPMNQGITQSTTLATQSKITTVSTDKITTQIKEHPLFTTAISNGGLSNGVLLTFDPNNIQLQYLRNRDTVETFYNYDPKTGGFTSMEYDNGIDAIGGSVITEFIIVDKNPSASQLLIGLNKAAPPRVTPCFNVGHCNY